MARVIGKREDYRSFIPLQTRWMDNDAYGHMNNATYYSLFDTAVTVWQANNGIIAHGPNSIKYVVVENGCKYHKEFGFPDQVDAGLRISHIGTSSFCYEVALFANGADAANAEGFFAQVLVDDDGRPKALPDWMRTTLQTIAQ